MSAFERVQALRSIERNLTIKAACEKLGVSEGSYYAARKRRAAGIRPRKTFVMRMAEKIPVVKRRPKE